jgi:hypothetical protein
VGAARAITAFLYESNFLHGQQSRITDSSWSESDQVRIFVRIEMRGYSPLDRIPYISRMTMIAFGASIPYTA